MNVKMIKGFMPKLYINKIAIDKMLEYIDQSNLEIGWLGSAERVNDAYQITDVFLFKQEVHATTTEITTEGLSEFAMELMQQENGVEIWNNMRVWGHSHVNMSTSPSSQDDKQMDLFLENSNDFFIRIIANKKEEFRIDIWDFAVGVIYESVPYDVVYPNELATQINSLSKQISVLKEKLNTLINPPQEIKDNIKNEIALKVKEKTYTSNNVKVYNDYSGNGRWFRGNKKNNVNRNIEKTAIEIFEESTDYEKYEMWEHIECGGTSCDLTRDEISLKESYILDDLIEQFVKENLNDYYMYLGKYY